MRVPSATYRLQFNRDFRFVDARALVPYLHKLGITDLYASPIFQARFGSAHGYDITDPTRLNAELGTEQDFDGLVEELRRHGMGLLLDIVPNHMAASVDNPWWADVLENGRDSRYAAYFDIDWDAHPEGRIVLPVLSAPLDSELERRGLKLVSDGDGVAVRYHDTRLPLSSATSAAVRRANRDPAQMSALLAQQAYELAFWRDGVQRLNYRRFFDITELVGVRVEEPLVFAATHGLIVRLARNGSVTGLRVDHIDGLRDPLGYLRRLQKAVSQGRKPFYVLVEKILPGEETLPAEWPTSGTTGYEFANVANALFVNPDGLKALGTTYRRFIGMRQSFPDSVYEQKKRVMRTLFAGELRALGERLRDLARQRAGSASEEYEQAIMEVSARLPIYRTYIRSSRVADRDRVCIERAIDDARSRNRTLRAETLQLLRRVLLLRFSPSIPVRERKRWLEFVLQWQQFTGPVTAKGLEDTALYNNNRLISLNDVGSDPEGAHVADAVERFHQHNAETLRRWPNTLNATSTHDTKRSEDVRSRINVLSEAPVAWARRLNRWSRLNRPKRSLVNSQPVPDPNEEVLLYQTLIGAWPLDAGEISRFGERVKAYMVKAAREAKANTSWVDPNEPYERGLTGFVGKILDDSRKNEFLEDFLPFEERIACCGALNSLAQTLLKITAPGVPDFYQGTEVWDFSLVDPDNRRSVDFAERSRLLEDVIEHESEDTRELLRRLLANWRSGQLKLYLTAKALAHRDSRAALFRSGDYIPLYAMGEKREEVVAFARARDSEWTVVAAPRLVTTLCSSQRPWVSPAAWKDTALRLPSRAPRQWVNILTGEIVAGSRTESRRSIECRALFSRFPVALLSGLTG